jgi:polyisoprenyl-teichoic acid--peptidoglycan teichoic acid transferase
MPVFDDSDRGPSMWKRLMIGAALVIFASASATAVAAFREVDQVVNALRVQPELKLGADIAKTEPGKPQTIMLLGSDRRPKNNLEGAEAGARSDTIILVRLDPKKRATALMSLPRDLKVKIPGHGTDKINAAYEDGGPRLTLKTVKQLTGLRINHVINIDFRSFYAGVNALGCVYADVDRRYFNNSAEFAYINVPAGYQRLCGREALQYVRYRHEDNDLVRSARQQDFLRQAKQQVGVGKLVGDRSKLVKIFGKYTSSDIRDRSQVLRIIKLAVGSIDQPVREVHFEGQIGASYVTADSRSVKKLARQFLGVEETPGPRGELRPSGPPRKKRKKTGGSNNLEDATVEGRDQGLQAVQQGLGKRLPVLYPTKRLAGSLFAGPPRVYKLKTRSGRSYASYRMVLKRGRVGEYYGVQGTTWQYAPILENPSEKRRVGKRTYELHYDGDRLRLVAWRTKKAVYWVSNTLLQSLSEREMLGIARSCRGL